MMKTMVRLIPLFAFAVSTGTAQVESATNSIPSSLQITGERSDEDRLQFLLEVAKSYAAEKDLESALGAYERILEIDEAHIEARFVASHLYIESKQYKQAESMILELIEEFPENFQLWNNAAWLYATADDPSIRDGKKAVRYAQEALTIAPNDYHIWSTLSEAYYVNGDYEKAHRAILQMVRLAIRYGSNVTEDQVKEYNEQILKCKRAIDAAAAMKGEE